VTAAVAFGVAACGGGPILANPPLAFPSPPVVPAASRVPDPIPLEFPKDDAPHDRLTEWWYYTGHLRTTGGRRFGFEAVIFRAERSSLPTGWVGHLAITDEAGGEFHYAQRLEVGPQVDRSRGNGGAATGFYLALTGAGPIAGGPALTPASPGSGNAPPDASPWVLAGSSGRGTIDASLSEAEAARAGASFGLNLDLSDARPPVLHDGDGFIEYGEAGSSYYYSRPRMDAKGTLELDGEGFDVEGTAWFDRQWGDYVSVGGGWDWFAVNLGDGTDVMLYVVRDLAANPAFVYGTLVERDGSVVNLDATDFSIDPLGAWTSPVTGYTWPSGWRVTIDDLVIGLEPTVLDQELDTRATTGVAYWEGSQTVSATRGGVPMGGEAYVELTRYSNEPSALAK
jgi:predicted secreted hydrolase